MQVRLSTSRLLAPVLVCDRVDVGSFSRRDGGHYALGGRASLVVLIPGERCLNASSGLFRLLGRAVCDDSVEWMCCPLGVRSGAQFDDLLDLCRARISSDSTCVDVLFVQESVVVTSGWL